MSMISLGRYWLTWVWIFRTDLLKVMKEWGMKVDLVINNQPCSALGLMVHSWLRMICSEIRFTLDLPGLNQPKSCHQFVDQLKIKWEHWLPISLSCMDRCLGCTPHVLRLYSMKLKQVWCMVLTSMILNME